MLRPFSIALLLLLLVEATPVAAEADACAPPSLDGPDVAVARADHQATGNRVVQGCGPMSGVTVDVDLGAMPTWVLPDPTDRGSSWLVVLEDGTVVHVVAAPGGPPSVNYMPMSPLGLGEPPLAVAAGDGQVIVSSALGAAALFDDALPDARAIEAPGATLMALTGPTDRYPHGVLGDGLEATAVSLLNAAGDVGVLEVGEDEVIEGLSPILADLDADGIPEILVTISTEEDGARLVAYDLAGSLVAQSDPIGRGFRWMHQIGVAALGPEAEIEAIAVRTPHIGGIVEAYRLVDDRLERVASQPGYSSHRLGSSNLDLALLADADGDGRLDVVVPKQELTGLGVLARTADGFEEIELLSLEGTLTTNVAATTDAGGDLVLAAGTHDGRLRIFR